jgi:hypothetical protein
MMAAKGWAAAEVLDAYTRARVLCESLATIASCSSCCAAKVNTG